MSRKDRNVERQEIHEEKRLTEELRELRKDIRELIEEIHDFLFPAAKGFKITQTGGDMTFGITKGNVGTFIGVPDPPGSALQAGSIPKWASDDPNASLTPSADGLSVSVATSATDAATSFNLTQSGVSSNGNPISSSVNVPLTAAAPVPATGFLITQTS